MAYKTGPAQDFLKAVGENIRHYRRKRGLSLEALGVDIGQDKGSMHKIESGRNITILTLLKISAFLGVDPQDLLDTNVNLTMEDMEAYVVEKKRKKKRGKKN